MHPCELAHASNAARQTSVTRWEVSTLPPTTAAVSEGDRKLPSGMMISMGFRHPWFSGIS